MKRRLRGKLNPLFVRENLTFLVQHGHEYGLERRGKRNYERRCVAEGGAAEIINRK